MKLRRLYIEKYRILQDLDIKFSSSDKQPVVALARRPGYAVDFLVGVNGAGKSTVLQILSDLMQRLEHGAQASIPYLFELEYDLDESKQKRRIKVSNLLDEEEETEYVAPVKERRLIIRARRLIIRARRLIIRARHGILNRIGSQVP